MSYISDLESGKLLNEAGQLFINAIEAQFGSQPLWISKYTNVKGQFYKYVLWLGDQQVGEVMVIKNKKIIEFEMYDCLAVRDDDTQGVFTRWIASDFCKSLTKV